MAVSTVEMTIEEFMRRFDQEGPFEIINGEIVPKMPNASRHGRTVKRILAALLPYEDRGEVFAETTFILTDSSNWVRGSRIPDVMFVMREKLDEFERTVPDADNKPFVLVPDLVVEIVSPTDQYSDVQAKVQRYLADGVRLVWVFDPQTKTVNWRDDSGGEGTLSESDTLDGGDVIPDLQIDLKAIFA